MQVTVLAGGIGAARFLRGLVSATGSTHDKPSVTVIGNTGDDIRLFGLQICPDLDSVMYTLGGGADEERGWGRANESFTVLEELRGYGAKPDWFGLGDRDIATHLVRTQALDAGYRLSTVTAGLCERWQLPVSLIPMTDDRVETHVVIDDPANPLPSISRNGGSATELRWQRVSSSTWAATLLHLHLASWKRSPQPT